MQGQVPALELEMREVKTSLVLLRSRSPLNIKGQSSEVGKKKHIYLSEVSVAELKKLTSADKSLLASCWSSRSKDYTDQVSVVFAPKSVGVNHTDTLGLHVNSSSSNCI